MTVSNPSENPAYINIFRDDTTIGNGQFLGYLQFCGRDATSSLGTAHAYVAAVAEADHGAGDNATAITFGTTPDNSSTISERVRIDSNGYLLVGTTNTSPTSNNVNGFALLDAGQNIRMTATSSNCLDVNRKADDGAAAFMTGGNTAQGPDSVAGAWAFWHGFPLGGVHS